ncbi:MAG: tRNA (adenosine(37)-N6)-threonylcarbamoyltransferase complex dimerization subunit type 1 TsaB [Deltaproteobacteria bacterium]|nr:tRNA (adenosine(37)-N6)-threonylcarbamoyltransferase complex dimerization subunit type 1 TsaB [Deltaproteobacteria bacterium]
MKLLSLSTAEQGCSLAIADGNDLVCEEFWKDRLTHSKRLLKMIEHMVEKRAGIELSGIDGFVAARGPGSFTGLRIGISVVKGLAYALEKPAFGVSSLDGIAFSFAYSSTRVCAMMDARRDEVYCAVYHFDQGKLLKKSMERVVGIKDAIGMAKGPAVFAGSGSRAYKEIIEKTACDPVIAHDFMDPVCAASLIRSLYSQEDFFYDPGNILSPSYIRKSDAQLKFG